MIAFIVTHLDWIAAAFELVGLYLVGNRNKVGFIFNLLCGVCWISYCCISKETYGILLVIIPALGINVRNYLRWRKYEKQT